MPDITMCKSKTCPSRESCYRYRVKPDEYQQSYYKNDKMHEDNQLCDVYWSINEYTDKNLVSMEDLEGG